MSLRAGLIEAVVADEGSWLDRSVRPRERGGTRGRGLQIIEGLMDEVEVAPSPSGTTVRMRRRLAIGAAA